MIVAMYAWSRTQTRQNVTQRQLHSSTGFLFDAHCASEHFFHLCFFLLVNYEHVEMDKNGSISKISEEQ